MEGEDNGQRGGRPGDDPNQIARDQEALRQLLDDLQQQLPGEAGEETRRALNEAERAMEDAEVAAALLARVLLRARDALDADCDLALTEKALESVLGSS